jgi:hypothetical protein
MDTLADNEELDLLAMSLLRSASPTDLALKAAALANTSFCLPGGGGGTSMGERLLLASILRDIAHIKQLGYPKTSWPRMGQAEDHEMREASDRHVLELIDAEKSGYERALRGC